MGHRRIGRGLRSSFGLFAVPVNIFITAVEVEGSKLDGGTLQLAIAGHPDGFFLVQHTPLITGNTCRSLRGSLDGRGSITTSSHSLSLMLLLSSRDGCRRGTAEALSRVPRISGRAGSRTSGGRFRIVRNLLEICLG